MLINDEAAIEQVKRAISDKFEANPELYDKRDVEKLHNYGDMVKRFLQISSQKRDPIIDAIKQIDEFFRWRKSIKINDIKPCDLPREVFELGVINYHIDRAANYAAIYFRAEFFIRCTEWYDTIINLNLYIIETILEALHWDIKMSILIFNCHKGALISEVDLAFSFRFAKVALAYPDIFEHGYSLDMPWYSKPVFYAVNKLMPKHKHLCQLVDRENLKSLLPIESLPDFLGGNLKLKYEAPKGCSNLDELAERFEISMSALKQLKEHAVVSTRKVNHEIVSNISSSE